MKHPKYAYDVGKSVVAIGIGCALWSCPFTRHGIECVYTGARDAISKAWYTHVTGPIEKKENLEQDKAHKTEFLGSLGKGIKNIKLEETGKTSTGTRRVFTAAANGRQLEIYEYDNSGKGAIDQCLVLCKELGDSALYIENTGIPKISIKEDPIYIATFQNLLKDMEHIGIERIDENYHNQLAVYCSAGNRPNIIDDMCAAMEQARIDAERIKGKKPGNRYEDSGKSLLLMLCTAKKD